jgi:hypothetical protein
MPIFIVYELGAPPQRVKLDTPPIRVGRDPSCDIVLREEGVSRDHAAFMMDEKGGWVVSCVSDTNPVLVDGVVTNRGAPVRDGTQILVGNKHLILFSFNEATATEYMGTSAGYASCTKCRWSGIFASLRLHPTCPRCGGTSFSGIHSFDTGDGARVDMTTRAANASDLAKEFERLVKAKRSALLRIDGTGKPNEARVPLTESEPVELSKGARGAAELRGMLVVGHAKVTWSGNEFVLHSHLSHPTLKVNGRAVEACPLKEGDEIEIGSNRFRFTTG